MAERSVVITSSWVASFCCNKLRTQPVLIKSSGQTNPWGCRETSPSKFGSVPWAQLVLSGQPVSEATDSRPYLLQALKDGSNQLYPFLKRLWCLLLIPLQSLDSLIGNWLGLLAHPNFSLCACPNCPGFPWTYFLDFTWLLGDPPQLPLPQSLTSAMLLL